MADVSKANEQLERNWGPREHLISGYLSAGGVRIMATEGDTVHLLTWNGGIHYLRSEDGGVSWGPGTRLVDKSGSQSHPSIHRSGSRLHVTWQDGRDGSKEPYGWRIYYKRSDDSGRTWGPDVRISSTEAKSFRLASAVSGSTIHAVWSDKRHNTIPDAYSTDGNWEIYHKRSQDGGETWGPDVRLTDSELVCQRPAIGIVGDTVLVAWVAWEECGRGTLDGAFGDIYYIKSTDGGESWGSVVRLTDTSNQSTHQQVITPEPGIIGILWESGRSYDFETKQWSGPVKLLFKKSTDSGETWTDERQINDGADATHATVCHFGAHVHVTWTDKDEIDGRKAAMYAFSPDGGETWGAPERLTPDGDWWAGPPRRHGGPGHRHDVSRRTDRSLLPLTSCRPSRRLKGQRYFVPDASPIFSQYSQYSSSGIAPCFR